jgi:hypothetical protein
MVNLPGWDSLEGVARWVTFYEIVMIGCLAALVGAEVLHFNYSHRKDYLTGIRERQQLEQAQRDQENVEQRRKAEVEGLQRKLEEADRKVVDLQKGTAPRQLTGPQKEALVQALRPYAGQKVIVSTVLGSDDGVPFANDFIEVFRTAQWTIDGPNQGVYDTPPIGLEPTVNQEEAQANRIPPSYMALVDTLANLGLAARRGFVNPAVPKGLIEMRVGTRPGPAGNP